MLIFQCSCNTFKSVLTQIVQSSFQLSFIQGAIGLTLLPTFLLSEFILFNESIKHSKFIQKKKKYLSCPVDTRRRFNVYKTSIRRRQRRIDVLQTLKRRRVFTGCQQCYLNMTSNKCISRTLSIIYIQPFNERYSHYVETSQLICSENQLIVFYMMGTVFVKGLNIF